VTDATARAQARSAPEEMRLDGRVALVTGAAGKLGPTWCAALAQAGATVVGLDLVAGGSCEEIGRMVHADVTDRASLLRAREALTADVGAPSVLVNGARIDQPPDAAARTYREEDVPVDQFRATVDVNLVGTFQAIQVFGAPMRDAGGGSIVNVGSLYASLAPRPQLYDHLEADPPFLKPAAYGASKAGVISLTRYFARLWGPHGVRVNALSPGGVRGGEHRRQLSQGQDPEFIAKYCEHVPLGRMAEPDDLTGPLVFLASDASRYVTGQELRVDGGFAV
jgi:NAD(P)-dependent dehydrogenase (short-subunit alcohol dehydrogenase family)